MNELKMRRMKSDACNSPLRRFLRVVFSVANHRVPIAENCTRSDSAIPSPARPGGAKRPEEGVRRNIEVQREPLWNRSPGATFETFRPSKVMNQRPFPGAGTPANYRQILPHGGMAEKLSNQ